MENKELYKTEINSKIKDINIEEGSVEFISDNDSDLVLKGYHESDCCENVYADFSVLKYYIESIKDKMINEIVIKGVIDMGFLLCLDKIKIFIPCYNYQNGYYSSNLELQIKNKEIKTIVNISNFVEDHID